MVRLVRLVLKLLVNFSTDGLNTAHSLWLASHGKEINAERNTGNTEFKRLNIYFGFGYQNPGFLWFESPNFVLDLIHRQTSAIIFIHD